MRKAPGGPEAAFRRIGVPRAVIGRPGGTEPFAKYTAFFEEGARRLDDPLFGLRLGAITRPTRSGLPGYITINSPTLRTAIRNLGRTLPVLVDGVDFRLDESDGEARITISLLDRTVDVHDRFDDHAFSFVISMLRGVMGRRWAPEEVSIRHPAPRDASLYGLIFGCPVRFGQPANVIRLDPGELNHRNREADRFLLALLLHTAEEGLARGTANLDFAAARFGLTPRTLQRQIRAEGTSFRALLDAVRLDRARHLLRETSTPITTIAFRLGYGEASSFSHAFERWTGQSPGRYRRHGGP